MVKAKELSRRQIETILRELEQRYKMTSADFYKKFQAGHLAHSRDFTMWAEHCAEQGNSIRPA
jgi:hypothetical protein